MMARAFRDLSPKVIFGSFRNFTGKRRVQFRRIVFPRAWEGHIGILVPALFYYPSEGCALYGIFVTIMKPVAINSAFKLCQNLPLYLP